MSVRLPVLNFPVFPCPAAIAVAAVAACAIPGAAFAATPAGTLLESRAEASFDTAGGRNVVQSNILSLRVDEVLAVAVTSTDGATVPLATAPVTLAFTLSNLGNGPEQFRLSTQTALPGAEFTPTISAIAIDRDGDGRFQLGVDTLVPPGTLTPSVASGGSLTVLVVAAAPVGAIDGARARIGLVAEAATGTGSPGTVFTGAGEGGTAAVVGLGGARADATAEVQVRSAAVSLAKSATVSDPFGGSKTVPGSFVEFRIEAAVSGTGSVEGLTVTDPLPAGTRYVAGSLTLEGAPLTDAADGDAGTGSTGGIIVHLGNLAGGALRTITYQISVE